MVFPKSTVKVVSKRPLGALGSIHAGPHHAAGGKKWQSAGPEKMHVRQWHVRSQLHGLGELQVEPRLGSSVAAACADDP